MSVVFDVNNADLRRTFLRHTFLERLDRLEEQASPKWGHMTPQHMVEHLIWSFEISRGRGEVDCPIPEERRKRAMVFLYNDTPTPQEFKNPVLPEEVVPYRYGSLSEAKAILRNELDQYFSYVETNPEGVHVHPVFGPLGVEAWERSHYKHAYHHLLQFGLI